MVSVADVVGLLVILGVNTLVAALATRFFRVRLSTRWGPLVYTLVLTPVALVLLTMALGGLGLGPRLGSRATVVGVTVVAPLAVGVTFDYFWQPAPEDVDLPDRYEEA